MKHLIITIVFLSLLFSCTIEKRLYNKGFHVEWKKNAKSVDGNIEKPNPISTDDRNELEPAVDDVLSEPSLTDETEANQNSIDSLDQVIIDDSQLKTPEKDTVFIYDDAPTNEPTGVAASLAFVASMIATRLTIIPGFGYIILFFFALAFILSIISMIRYSYQRGYYKSNILGVLTFILCMVTILVFAILIIALLSW